MSTFLIGRHDCYQPAYAGLASFISIKEDEDENDKKTEIDLTHILELCGLDLCDGKVVTVWHGSEYDKYNKGLMWDDPSPNISGLAQQCHRVSTGGHFRSFPVHPYNLGLLWQL